MPEPFKIADARMVLWTGDYVEGPLLDRFGYSLNRPIERRIEAWKKKRDGRLPAANIGSR